MENMGTRVGSLKGTLVAMMALALLLAVTPMAAPPAAAGVLDPNVALFDVSPSYINVNRKTNVTVEIGASYGPGMDNYLVTVTAPDSSAASSWYNFTAIGSMVQTFGNASADFMMAVTQTGTYDVRLEYFDGAVFSLAGLTEFKVTDKLTVTFLIRSASNPATNEHSCPVASEFVRGGKFIGGAYVAYASTGELVTDKNSNAAGNITGAILGETRVMVGPPIWHGAWLLPWNSPTGEVKFYVNASDGMGNTGSAVTGEAGTPRVTIVPDALVVTSRILNATGAVSVAFAPGDTIQIEAHAWYDDHAARNAAYEGPLNATRNGQVTVHIGWGAFNATSGRFANTLTDLSLTLDPTTETWRGSYVIPTTTGNLTAVQAVVTASDGANPPNVGAMMSTQFQVRSPAAPQIVEVPGPATGFDMPVVAGLSVVLLIVGLAIGLALSRRGGRGKEPGAKAEEEMTDEWEEET